MMSRSRSFRADAAGFLRTAAHAVAAALAVTAALAAVSALLCAGLLASASSALAQARAPASSPAPVKYYIVPPATAGQPESLYQIAARTLRDGGRYMEIFSLNKGRLQPNGERLESPRVIESGWILQLPPDASGPGVHFGPLLGPTPSASPKASDQPSRPPAPRAAGSPAGFDWLGTGGALVLGCALVGLTTVGLAAGFRRRRGSRTAGRRRRTGSREPGLPAELPTAPTATAGFGAPPAGTQDTGPQWPQASAYDTGPHRPQAPAYDTGPHRPQAPAHDTGPRWAHVPAESSWPDWGPPPELHPDHPSAPVPRVRAPVSRWESPPAPPGGGPGGARGRPQHGSQHGPERWPEQPPRTPGAMPQIHAEMALGGGRPRAVLTGAPALNWERPADSGPRAQGVVQATRDTASASPVRWEVSEVRNADPVWLAGRFLSVADAKATEITRAASGQAAEMTRAASGQAAEIRAAAERDAAEIRRQAAEQAAEIRAAAEWEATEARTAVMTMSAELSRVAAYVSDTLVSPEAPAKTPDARPARRPETRPARRPETRPDTKPEVRPASTPDAQPSRKPDTRPRQYAAMRLTAVVMAALMLFAVTAGSTEVALHGFRFFVFRSAGTGASGDDAPSEDRNTIPPAAGHQPRAEAAMAEPAIGTRTQTQTRTTRPQTRPPHDARQAQPPPRKTRNAVDTWMDQEFSFRGRMIKRQKAALWLLGFPALMPIFFMSRAVITANNNTMNSAVADVLGNGGEALLLLTLLITPMALLTRQRWFTPLRQWYGIMMAVTVITDATIASITTAFAGGVIGRLAGHTFLLVGFTMVLITIPLLATANNRSQRWLGRYWKQLQRMTYAIWGLLFIHLALLFGFGVGTAETGDGDPIFHQRLFQLTACSALLLTLRLPPVRRWVAGQQKAGRAWLVYLVFMPLAMLFLVGLTFIVNEEIFKGVAAFSLHPISD
jgi:DMSO/TMAO reductase YedYZ heme-binding membrane subunit